MEILFASLELPSSHNPAQKEADVFQSPLAATKGKVTGGNNIGRLNNKMFEISPRAIR